MKNLNEIIFLDIQKGIPKISYNSVKKTRNGCVMIDFFEKINYFDFLASLLSTSKETSEQ